MVSTIPIIQLSSLSMAYVRKESVLGRTLRHVVRNPTIHLYPLLFSATILTTASLLSTMIPSPIPPSPIPQSDAADPASLRAYDLKSYSYNFFFPVESSEARKMPSTSGYTSKNRVLDRYKVVGFISSGTYGRVYKAVGHNGMAGEFAIKKSA